MRSNKNERAWGRRVFLLLAVSVSSAVAGLLGCNSGATQEDGRPTVVATTTMIADAARIIGGDEVRVISIMRETEDPHTYKVKPRDATRIAEADLVLMNGLHLEATLAHIVDEQAQGAAVRLAEHDNIDLLRPVGSGAAAAPDPHCWMNVQYFTRYAEGIRDALIELDPEHANGYRERAAAYIAQLEKLDAWVREQIESIPEQQRVLISSHDAFGYYGRAYGIEVHGVGGISTDQQVQARHIGELEGLVRERGITTVFDETSVKDSLNNQIKQIATHTDAVVSDSPLFSDSLDAPDQPAGNYIGMIRHNTTTIVEALRGDE